jgi:hypothetical protein
MKKIANILSQEKKRQEKYGTCYGSAWASEVRLLLRLKLLSHRSKKSKIVISAVVGFMSVMQDNRSHNASML